MSTRAIRPWIVIVGGFLGSGKTTLILAAAQELERRGIRSAIILNDQGGALVDTDYARLNGRRSGEVTGGCFCCKFSDLVRVMAQLRAHSPEVIFAEPVGSCTDISATILHPLLECGDEYRLAPFTVLVDPQRATELLGAGADPSLSFLFRNQLQEADVVSFTKSDLYSEYPAIPAKHIRQVSAQTGQGVAAWLDEVLSGRLMAGSQILDIDYQEYARAEAALVWLNLQVHVEPRIPCSSSMLLGPLLQRLDAEFTAHRISIVHLKAIMKAPTGFLKAAMCANGQPPVVGGDLSASPASSHDLLLNLRTLGSAVQVREIVENELGKVDGTLSGLEVACFHPAAPKPERRARATG